MKNLKNAIEKCRTAKQVYKVLDRYNKTVVKDNTSDYNGRLSIWIDDKTRIYQSSRGMVYQVWQVVEEENLSKSVIDEAKEKIMQFVKKYSGSVVMFAKLPETEKYDFVLTATYNGISYNNPLMDIKTLVTRAIKNANAGKNNGYQSWQYETLTIL